MKSTVSSRRSKGRDERLKKAKKRKDYPADWRPMSASDRDILCGLLIALAVLFVLMLLFAYGMARG